MTAFCSPDGWTADGGPAALPPKSARRQGVPNTGTSPPVAAASSAPRMGLTPRQAGDHLKGVTVPEGVAVALQGWPKDARRAGLVMTYSAAWHSSRQFRLPSSSLVSVGNGDVGNTRSRFTVRRPRRLWP